MKNDQFYDMVAEELQNRTIVPGLWAKAYAEAEGDTPRARALYIKYRTAQLGEIACAQEEAKPKQKQSVTHQYLAEWTPQIVVACIMIAALLVFWFVFK